MSTEKEKMLRGEPYDSTDPQLVAERIHIRKLVKEFNNLDPEDTETYQKLFKEMIPNQGEKCFVEPPVNYDYGSNITMGEGVYMNFNSIILDVSPVHIGDHCLFGPRCSIYTATHPIDAEERKLYEYSKAITIGNDCFIGGSTTICPGVTIGDRVVIGAGSVVCKDIPSDCVAAGNPCKVIKTLPKPEKKEGETAKPFWA
ncbi:hypothetical protein WA158_000053 [Blastocystis sp. Blastoise]